MGAQTTFEAKYYEMASVRPMQYSHPSDLPILIKYRTGGVNFIIIVGALILACFVSFGQSIPPPPVAQSVEVDITNLQVKTKLPFDAPFVLLVTPAKDIATVRLLSITEAGTATSIMPLGLTVIATQPAPINPAFVSDKLGLYYVPINGRYARPNQLYSIAIEATLNNGTTRIFNVQAYTDASLSDNVKIDFGVGYVPDAKATIGLTSAHFYGTPINDNADLGSSNISLMRRFLIRTSFFVGLSPLTFSENDAQPIKNRYKLGSLVYGIGYRSPFYGVWLNNNHLKRFGRTFLQPMRVNVGILNFSQSSGNPAITDDVNKHTFFVSLTYDLNISTVLGPIGKLFQ